jgi:hypothetical protein
MRWLALLLAALTVTAAADAQAPQPLTFWRYGMPDQWRLQQGLDCAIARWRAATCLPIDVSYSAAHWVRFALPQDIPGDSTAVTSGASWNSMRIRVLSTLSEPALCPMLVHEMGHILRRNSGHSDEDGSMSYEVVHVASSTSLITTHDLELVCAKQPCGCMIPE